MKLVFFGGVHGVGKTTLLEKVLGTLNKKPHVVDPGVLFWEHVYRKKDKTADETEVLVAEAIERECSLYPVVICNWHYAVWTLKGYIPQIAFPRLASLVERVGPECVHLILVDAPVDVVLERRKKDRSIKRRKVDRACVAEEIAQTTHLHRLHYDVLSLRVRTLSTMLDNTGPIDEAAAKKIGKILYETS